MTLPFETYQLDKWVWTDEDFDIMGWHDSSIYAFKIDQNLYFDIDYIFKWVQPGKDLWFSFWVAPCTLIFDTPSKFKFNLETTDSYNDIEVADLHKQQNENGKIEWRIETHIGDITIEANTFRQIVRRPPTLKLGQQVIPEERGETSFSIFHDKIFKKTEEVKQIKQKDFQLRQTAMTIKQLQGKLTDLFNRKMNNEIDTKQYIINKRKIETQILTHRQELIEMAQNTWQTFID